MIRYLCTACSGVIEAGYASVGLNRDCPHCGQGGVVPSPVHGKTIPPDFDEAAVSLWRRVQAFTMTSIKRVFALSKAVEHVVAHRIPGDIVECGVWRGGSMMAVALTLIEHGAVRRLHLFDTFEGMPPPGQFDQDLCGEPAAAQLQRDHQHASLIRAYSPLDEVRGNLESTGYDPAQIRYVPGRVEETLPACAPPQIALLRLDTDWYESTYHELVHLYPRLSPGGVLIIDDYGHWQGARRAVDQYLSEHRPALLLCRIDYTGRIAVKPAD
jgi:hypothetical protein